MQNKIAIGINIFGKNRRQDLCIDVLTKFSKKYNNIKLYNITFNDETNYNENFIHLPLLKTKAKDIIKDSKSEKPITKEFFEALSKQDCDYFLFINSDILISEKLIKLLSTTDLETASFSRADCYEITGLDKIIPYRIEIAGFDAWFMKKDWYEKNSNLFRDYVYAEHLWDVDYAVHMFNFSKSKIFNKEIYIYHEKHPLNWNEESVEALHNASLWGKTPYHKRFKDFVYTYLIKRIPYGQFLYPLPDEEQKEIEFLICK
jgi:hypothetical protein